MKLGIKAKRNIGLIVLTVVVVAAVILTVYLVQRSDDSQKLKNAHIGQKLTCKDFEFSVVDVKNSLREFGGETPVDGYYFMAVTVVVNAKKNIKIDAQDFPVADAKHIYADQDGYDVLDDKGIYLKGGQDMKFALIYEAEAERAVEFYMRAFGYKINLGGTVSNVLGGSGADVK